MKFRISLNIINGPMPTWTHWRCSNGQVFFCSKKAAEKYMSNTKLTICGLMSLKETTDNSIRNHFGIIFRVEPVQA